MTTRPLGDEPSWYDIDTSGYDQLADTAEVARDESGNIRTWPSGLPVIIDRSTRGVPVNDPSRSNLTYEWWNYRQQSELQPELPPVPPPIDTTPPDPRATREALQALYPGIPQPVIDMLLERYVDHGDMELAWAEVRVDTGYESYFPGIKRDDGSLRMTEMEYMSYKEFVSQTIRAIGINPELFTNSFVQLIEGDVSPAEFDSRVSAAYRQVIEVAPELSSWYAENYGIAMTPEALLASYLDPNVGTDILEGRYTTAEIAAQGEMRGFDISFDLADRLREFGVSRSMAAEAFGEATEIVPIVNTLAKRHFDPDDDFDINEFSAATLMNDPFQMQRIRRLFQRESALYRTRNVLAGSSGGLVTGLTAR